MKTLNTNKNRTGKKSILDGIDLDEMMSVSVRTGEMVPTKELVYELIAYRAELAKKFIEIRNIIESNREGKRFVFVKTTEKNRELITGLSMKNAGVLMVLLAKMSWSTGIVVSNKKDNTSAKFAVSANDLAKNELSMMSPSEIRKALRSLESAGILEVVSYSKVIECGGYVKHGQEKERFVQINPEFAFRGSLKDNKTGVEKQFRIYCDEALEKISSGKLDIRLSGMLMKVALHLHRNYNFVVSNPQETNILKIEPITITDFCRKVGISTKTLYSIMKLEGGEMLEKFEVIGRTSKKKAFLTVNDAVLSHASVPKSMDDYADDYLSFLEESIKAGEIVLVHKDKVGEYLEENHVGAIDGLQN